MKNSINIARHRKSTADHSTLLASTQSDRARLIYSAAFRRLQQKAQVFSLESNSAVRSRLTHSIEVSHIGRYIVAMVSEKIECSEVISSEIKDYWKKNSLVLSNIVETACLMHDIGNPPFGHFGEAAISQWARSTETADCLKKALSQTLSEDLSPLKDFMDFDGNPQGFRIITKLQGDDGFFGLNLTYTQLAAFLKYTYSPNTKDSGVDTPFSKKIGFFDTELKVITAAWDTLGMPLHTRHPLGFIMEASDDISYCISDIEDGIEKGIIQVNHFIEHMQLGINNVAEKYNNPDICNLLLTNLTMKDGEAINSFLSFKTKLSNYLVNNIADKFIDNYEQIITFKQNEELISKDSIEYDLLKVLKIYTGEFLFTSHEAECMELSGFSIISGILDVYKSLLELESGQFLHLLLNDYERIKEQNLHFHRRLFNRLPEKHLNAYKAAVCNMSILEARKKMKINDEIQEIFGKIEKSIEWNLRAHLIIDFVSGMTDQFSMEFYQMLKGINVKY